MRFLRTMNLAELVAIGLIVISVGLAFVPTSTHADVEGSGDDMFFSCGFPVLPDVDPAGESATAEDQWAGTNQQWRMGDPPFRVSTVLAPAKVTSKLGDLESMVQHEGRVS